MKQSHATGALNALWAQRAKTSTSLLSNHRNEGGRHRRSKSPHVSNSETDRTTKPTNPSGWRLAEPRGIRSAVKQLARMIRGLLNNCFTRNPIDAYQRTYTPGRSCQQLRGVAPHAPRGVGGLPAHPLPAHARPRAQPACPPAGCDDKFVSNKTEPGTLSCLTQTGESSGSVSF